MPINIESLFQKGGYTAGGVSPSSGSSGPKDTPLDVAKFNLEKEKFEQSKKLSDSELNAANKLRSDDELINKLVQNYTTVDEENQTAETDSSKVLAFLDSSGKADVASRYRERLVKDMEVDVKEMTLVKSQQELATNFMMDSMDKAAAGDGEGALISANEASKMTGGDPIVDIGYRPSYNGQPAMAKIKTKSGQEQEIDVEQYRKSLVDSNVIFNAQQAKELQLLKNKADSDGLKLSEVALKEMASRKLEAWKQGVSAGVSEQKLVADYGYIDDKELAYIVKQRNLLSTDQLVSSAAANQDLLSSLKGSTEEKLVNLRSVADTMYKAQISKEVPGAALHPSIRSTYSGKGAAISKQQMQKIRSGISSSPSVFSKIVAATGSKAKTAAELTDEEIIAYKGKR